MPGLFAALTGDNTAKPLIAAWPSMNKREHQVALSAIVLATEAIVFDIETSFDFYKMLVADWDELMMDKESTRKAIHCIILANHLPEWVWHDWLCDNEKAKSALGIADQEDFRVYLRGCIWLDILRGIANGTKHFARQPFRTEHVRGYGQGPYGVGPYGQGYLLIDLGEGAGPEHQFMPALNLIEVCVRFWRDFFKKYRPDVELTHSTNHAI